LRVDVSKNPSTAASSNEGAFGHIDDHRGARDGIGEALAGERVDARVG
jgi:hypothetical protein